MAYNYFAGGAGGDVTNKPVICPAGYKMTGTRMFGVSKSVDDEHVDAYCCPLS
ncbi:shufflon protein C' [Salmonella enterica subsp. enterica serovar Infantis]|nr:shufflon protein C' [Salmonella enterica]EBM9091909.1 shufflon protein C' [Salmonella enterica subsp. enterica serovar Infantis]EBO2340267.1 shufflon protein C' [Salmonella enterica subsp. enterica serovar Infantis]ECJ1199930.1 shufflon protein C' [Salmonella enterica]EDI3151666.1 shufflon protein C' [Salmonella enterica subsp. enterica serovar Infantis]